MSLTKKIKNHGYHRAYRSCDPVRYDRRILLPCRIDPTAIILTRLARVVLGPLVLMVFGQSAQYMCINFLATLLR